MSQGAGLQRSLVYGYRDEIEQLIGDDLIPEALDRLQDFVRDFEAVCGQDQGFRRDVLTLRRRFTSWKSDQRVGIAHRDDVNPIVARIAELNADISKVAVVPNDTDRATTAVLGKLLVGEGPVSPPLEQTMATPIKLTEQPADKTSSQVLHPANDAGGGADSLDDLRRLYWQRMRRERPPSETLAVRCTDVSKRYRKGQFNLRPLSFDLRAGEITGIIGRNASGKTTLLRIIMGELLPDTGQVEYPMLTRNGRGWTHIKLQMADVPQFPEKWHGRLRHNLNYTVAVRGIRGARNRELVDWHMERFGLTDYEDATWDEISGGYKIRFELVRALLSQPKLLVLDEPLAYLDVIARQEFLKNLRAVAASLENPVPVVITSQHLYEIEAVADQMILLDDGKCLYAGPQDLIGSKVPLRMIEVTLRASTTHVQATLTTIGLISAEATMEGFILGFPRETPANVVYNALYATYGVRLVDFRDISYSSRSLFQDKSSPTADTLEGRVQT